MLQSAVQREIEGEAPRCDHPVEHVARPAKRRVVAVVNANGRDLGSYEVHSLTIERESPA